MFAIFFLFFFLLLSFSLFQSCSIPNCLECSSTTSDCLKCEKDFIYQRDDEACVYVYPCPFGFFKDARTGACLACDSSCHFCFGPFNYQCYSCVKGFYLEKIYTNDYLFKCITCPAPFCAECDENGVCQQCANGYFLEAVSVADKPPPPPHSDGPPPGSPPPHPPPPPNKCTPCKVENCDQCEEDKCLHCKIGYIYTTSLNLCVLPSNCRLGTFFDIGNNECKECAKQCANCFGATENDCYECKEGYYFNMNNTCIACDSNCRGCDDDGKYCVSCPVGKVLRGHTCADKCQNDEYFDNIELKCKECDGKCGKCVDRKDKCTQCFDEIFYNFNSQEFRCDPECPDGQVPSLNRNQYEKYLELYMLEFIDYQNMTNIDFKTGSCLKCSDTCKTCYILPDFCTSCPEDNYLLNKKCLKTCPKGYFPDTKAPIRTCNTCQYPCIDCLDFKTCSECVSPFSLLNDSCYYNQTKIEKCQEWEFEVGVVCRNKCPEGSFPIDKKCYCSDTCTKCFYILSLSVIECRLCQNPKFFSYNGVCYPQCSEKTWVFNEPGYTKYCFDSCPKNLFKLVNETGLFCKYNCPLNYEIINGYCLLRKCPTGYFFTTENIEKSLILSVDFNYTEAFCRKCDESCRECKDGSAKTCISCANLHYLQFTSKPNDEDFNQLYFISMTNAEQETLFSKATAIYEKYGISCLNTCPKGYMKINNMCFLCTKYCYECDDNLFLYQNKCVFSCPNNTQIDYLAKTCSSNFQIDLKILNSKSYYISYVNDIVGQMRLNSVNPNDKINKIACTLITMESKNEIFIQNYGYLFVIYNFTISKEFLKPSQKSTINCLVYYNEKSTEEMNLYIQTFSEPFGYFEADPQIGRAGKDNLYIKIYGWQLKENPNNDLSLNYILKIIDKQSNRNLTLLEGSDEFLLDSKTVLTLKKNINFTFPLVDTSRNLTLELTVYNDFTETVNNLEIKVIMDSTIQSILNGANSSVMINWTDPISLNFLANELSSAKKNLSVQNFKPEKIMFLCDPKRDCSGKGFCLNPIITDEGSVCGCYKGFEGYLCQWDETDFRGIKNLTCKIIDSVSNWTDNYNIVLEVMNSIGDVVDVFDDQLHFKVLDLLQKQTDQIKTVEDAVLMIEILDKYFGMMKYLKSAYTPDFIFSNITDVIHNIINSTTNMISNKIPMNGISISSPNIKLDLQNMESLFKNSVLSNGYNMSLNSTGNNLTMVFDSQNKYFKFLFYNSFDFYAQTSLINSDLIQTKRLELGYFASDLFNIEIKQKESNRKMEISDNTTVFNLSFPAKDIEMLMKFDEDFECRYFDDESRKWSTVGLKTYILEGEVKCLSSHMSRFSVFLKKIDLMEEKMEGGFFFFHVINKKWMTIFIVYCLFFLLNLIILSYIGNNKVQVEGLNSSQIEKSVTVKMEPEDYVKDVKKTVKIPKYEDSPEKK